MNIGLTSLLIILVILLAVLVVVKITSNIFRIIACVIATAIVVYLIWAQIPPANQQEILDFLNSIKDQAILILKNAKGE